MRISLLLLIITFLGFFVQNGYGLCMIMFGLLAFSIVAPIQFINRLFEQLQK
jgi:hypothetical protein